MTTTLPPYLKKGDTIALTCPAGYMTTEKAQTCINTLQQWGYNVMVGKTLGSHSENYFSGTDEERLNELQAMLENDSIKAILFGRGGYGMSRIIDRLNFKKFKKNPKWLVGYSDITLLHTHVYSNHHIATLHAPMAAAFNDGGAEDPYILSIKKTLEGKKNKYTCSPHPFNKKGKTTGVLVGGNLTLLTHAIGTASDTDFRKKILFIEDVGEQLYKIDRLLHQLKRAKKLDKLAGLIIGGFTDMGDTDRPFGQTIESILNNLVEEYDYPICYNFPIGHRTENYALTIGGIYTLKVSKSHVMLSQ
jgi:muramoyltetrapeptide carboxypeptidase